MVILFKTGDNSRRKVNNFQQSGIICSRTATVNSDTIPHARDNQTMYNGQHNMLREEAPQVAETDQQADTYAHHVTDMGVPDKVTVEENIRS